MASGTSIDLTRREFVASWGSLLAGASFLPSCSDGAQIGEVPARGEPLTLQDLEASARVAGMSFSAEEMTLALPGVQRQLTLFRQRLAQVSLDKSSSPAMRFDPLLPGRSRPEQANRVVLSQAAVPRLPGTEEDIAYAPLTHLSEWVRSRQLSSERLSEIYLRRLGRFDSQLHCVVTLTRDLARQQARRADRELAQGRYRGPLHGIPWGAKDLLDTAGIGTTWGAAPFRDRVAERDAAVVQRLEAAGAVLVAKLTLGALAMGDVWFDDTTRNPFNPEQGSSGSSAGSAAATAAGLVGFSIGTETLGSIVSPCMRCGTTGLRPTFGRVARTGAMPLCWSLDKIGPICRRVEDAALVLAAIHGADEGDPSSVDCGFEYDGRQDLAGLKVGYSPGWFEGQEREGDRRVLAALRGLGLELVEVDLPDLPYSLLYTILNVEAAAAFEDLTRSHRDDLLVRQSGGAWPNLFRKAWYVPAVECLQLDRLRRQAMEGLAGVFDSVDLVSAPSFGNPLLVATNFTGHPSLTLRTGFREDQTPTGTTLWGRLFDEGTLCRVGAALERELGVWDRRPELS